MDDIVPSLLEKIQEEFEKQFRADRELSRLYGKVKSKTITYKDANTFAVRLGEILAESYKKYITVGTLPEGRMWYNIAQRILGPTLHTNYSLIRDVCDTAQSILNDSAGIGMKVVTPEFNNDRLMGIVNKISNAENFADVQWLLDDPIVNFTQSIVDEYIEQNAEQHYKSGLTPKIRRTLDGRNACAWCRNLAGEYEYPYVPRDVYRKHENCRCVVEYVEDGKRQNVHTKTWVDGYESPKAREQRIRKLAEEQAKEQNRINEALAVAELMRQHPDWSREGATIYYRTQTGRR